MGVGEQLVLGEATRIPMHHCHWLAGDADCLVSSERSGELLTGGHVWSESSDCGRESEGREVREAEVHADSTWVVIRIASRSTLRYTYLGDMAVASSPAGPVLTGPVFCEVVPSRACAEL